MSEMRLELHHEIPEDEEFRQRWNALAGAMEHPQVFYTWEWAAAVAHAYSDALRPLLFTGYEGEMLVGIAALAVDANARVCFLASTTADYCDFVSAPADREKLIELVMSRLREMGRPELALANLPADSASAMVLRSVARKSGYAIFARPAYLCAQIPLRSAEEREKLAGSARRNSKRAKKALAAMGEVVVDHRGTSERFAVELPALATASVARFLALGRASNLVSRARRRFLEELGRTLSAQGALALSTLKVGDRTVAWHYGFQYAGVWFWYLPVFDSTLQHLRPGPGSCLFYEILLRAAEDPGIHTLDMGLGDESYKERYATTGRRSLYVTASQSRTRLAREFCRYTAAKLVSKSPLVAAQVRKLRARFTAARVRFAERGILASAAYYSSRAVKTLFDDDEIIFFDWPRAGFLSNRLPENDSEVQLRSLSINLLAAAAMQYETDAATQDYLFRAAARLRSAESEGYALVTAEKIPVSIWWVAPFEGFRIPRLSQALKEPAPGAVLIFDAWTPASQCGSEYGWRAAGRLADFLQSSGRRAWTFSADSCAAPELERVGFVPRFSLQQKRRLFTTSSRLELRDSRRPVMDLDPAA